MIAQQVGARAGEEREVDVLDRRVSGALVRAAALIEDPQGVGRSRRRQLAHELGQRQLSNVIPKVRDLSTGRTPLDDERQPRERLAAQVPQALPFAYGPAVGGGDHELACELGAQPDPGERPQAAWVARGAVAEALAERLEHVAGDSLTPAPRGRMHDDHPAPEIVQHVDRRRPVHHPQRP
jgi:hypothetical protein